MNRTVLIYVVILVVFGLGIYFLLDQGRHLQAPPRVALIQSPVIVGPDAFAVAKTLGGSASSSIETSFLADLKGPLSQLFIQLILTVAGAMVMGAMFKKVSQPAVIGEMMAGILLGPSFFGWIFPGVFQLIFPLPSLGTLKMLSQIGVCLFMFVIGMELEVNQVRQHASTAVLVSHVSIVFPFFLGVALSIWLYPEVAAPGASFVAFALFLGISMSITAFPVLARILDERNMAGTALGSMAITCAAVDDVTAWNILALVVAIAKGGGWTASLLRIGLVAGYVAFMLYWVRPRLPAWFGNHAQAGVYPGKSALMGVLLFVLGSSLITEVIGIHALFGAFLAGVSMPPHGAFRDFIKVRLEHFSSTFLLPLFFAFTGLRTQIGLLDNLNSWIICLVIIAVATLGKMGGSMIAARFTGMNWRDSFALGVLMNTRGLMELIALNVGYDLGILSPRIFATLVIMALVTTLLTGPLLTKAQMARARHRLAPEAA